MKAVKTFAIGAVGAAALVAGAAPAAAQYYPNPGYGGYGQYGYPPNVIGQVLQSILNPYGQFGYQRGVNPQVAVQQCTAAVQQRLQYQYRAGYGGYGGYGQYGAYGQYGYGNAYSQARVLGISRVEQRSASTLRVRGVATSGMVYGGYPYGGYGGYGQGGYGGYGGYGQSGYGYAQAQPDLIFRCDVDYRGYIRDIDIDRID